MAIFVKITQNKYVKERDPPPVKSELVYSAITGTRCEIGYQLVLSTNRHRIQAFR